MIANPPKNYKWIEMVETGKSASGLTQTWSVVTKEGGAYLGDIKWFARWRCYGFFPATETVYEHNCLWDIADFIANQTSAHREARKRAA